MKEDTIDRRRFIGKASAAAVIAAFSSIKTSYAKDLVSLANRSGVRDRYILSREEYLLDPDITYFNHASIGTIPKLLHRTHKAYIDLCEKNPWLYTWGEPWDKERTKTRKKLAEFVGCEPGELALTHNTTEGFNVLANGLPLTENDEVVFSTLNHPGASECWFHHAMAAGYSINRFEFPIRDVPDLSEDDIVSIYAEHITEKTRVLVFPHIDNLVGIRYPIEKMVQMARENGVEFIAVDGAQALGMVPIDLQDLGVDFYAMSPHKWLQAPKGTGLLYIRKAIRDQLEPLWVTWGQNRWKGTVRIFEDYGTRNLASVLALGDAVDFQIKFDVNNSVERRKELRAYFFQALENDPNIEWRSPRSWELGSSLYTIEVKGQDSQELFKKLYEQHGYVFRAFKADNWNTLRVSLNTFNTLKEIDTLVELLS
ncbi:aminotransferase class V-fold PLP-dependent enzyme [Fulvivirgaceae bacterium BMA10]|uniref:Aminotransferase class V-fold PLP-dependent enzyme n=1 Tax=Splendidivirga corallicola TaxID=3051826 RepID=A0ABT8KSH4_9BACT|nr:aminotransferase class V-fold PLP-dependent enzyme [Fulvivirgaceae bacterium BMA10]